MLWSGRIFDPHQRTPATQGIRELTRLITSDPGWMTLPIIPVRDGLLAAYKK